MNPAFKSNKTSQYLLPIFKTLDTEFKTQLNIVVPNILKLSVEDIEYTVRLKEKLILVYSYYLI